jgi:hypothetical protein
MGIPGKRYKINYINLYVYLPNLGYKEIEEQENDKEYSNPHDLT